MRSQDCLAEIVQVLVPERSSFSMATLFLQRPHFMKCPSASFCTVGLSEVIFQALPPAAVFISSA